MPTSDNSVDLRGEAPRDLIDMLDAISAHKRVTRWFLVMEILENWRQDKEREAVVVARVTGVLGDRRSK